MTNYSGLFLDLPRSFRHLSDISRLLSRDFEGWCLFRSAHSVQACLGSSDSMHDQNALMLFEISSKILSLLEVPTTVNLVGS